LRKKPLTPLPACRARRIKIDEENKGLSWEEKPKKTRHLLETDLLWLKLKNRLVDPAVSPFMAVLEA